MASRTLFLMYHAVLAEGKAQLGAAADSAYAVPRHDFCAQLDAIAAHPQVEFTLPAALTANSYTTDFNLTPPPSPGEEVEAKTTEEYDGYGVCLTFDDAWREHLTVTASELLARGIPAIFFIASGQVGAPGMLTWDEVRELARQGFVIGSHGISHRFMTGLSDEELLRELWESRGEIEAHTEERVRLLSFPGGRGAEREVELALRKDYAACFGSRPEIWREERLRPIGRYAIRAGRAGCEQVTRLLADPEAETARLLLRYEKLARWKNRLGDRLYQTLHGWWARWRGGGMKIRR